MDSNPKNAIRGISCIPGVLDNTRGISALAAWVAVMTPPSPAAANPEKTIDAVPGVDRVVNFILACLNREPPAHPVCGSG
jgi:hypothetical protein